MRQGDAEGALTTWRRVEQQSVPHVALVAARLMDGYRTVGRPQEGVNLLRSYLARGVLDRPDRGGVQGRD